jgi:hypothetical protein
MTTPALHPCLLNVSAPGRAPGGGSRGAKPPWPCFLATPLTLSPFHVASVFRSHNDSFAGFDEGGDEGFDAVA